MTAVFIDLSMAFDLVDRDILMKTMRERGIREGLVIRMEEILRETKSKVRIGGQIGKEFWMIKGVRKPVKSDFI